MQTLDVCKKDSGKIWHRKPLPKDDGQIVSITHNVSSALSDQSKCVRFLHAAFDVSGDKFVAGDYQGNIYLFDLHVNRFSLVQKTGSPCTALAFTLRRKTEFLAGLADYSLKCYDTEAKELVAWMKGHDSVIQDISIHASGRYALTSSSDTAQLWDLDTFQRKRKLNIKENVGIVKVFFLPLSNTILTAFKDSTVFAWEADTLNCKYQLHTQDDKNTKFKAFTASRDGRVLVGGGKSRFLHIWALDTRKLQRIIELPAKITQVKQLEFLPDSFDIGSNQILGVLGQDGMMRFIDTSTCKLLFDIGNLDDRINRATVSPTGKHIAAVMDSGNVNVYSVQAISKELNQPPPPLVKVLKSNRMADTSQDSEKKGAKRGGIRSKKSIKDKENRQEVEQDESQELPEGMSMDRLSAILKGFGEYPAKYRMFIWRSILRLPENHAAYGALVDKGTHPAFENVHQQYPIKSRKLLRVLQRVLSALAHWSPIFGETSFLPMLTFPFVKLFQNNQLVAFEVVATTLVNFAQHWFEYFPNPPINVLGMIENVLAHHDKKLLSHFVKYDVNSQIYAWPLLQTLLSEVLTREEWLRLFDNVFSNHPAFTLMVVVAYCIVNRGPLVKCTELDDFKYFFHHRNAVDVGQVIKEAYRLMDTTPEDIHPQNLLEPFTPLTRGQYPVFNRYPKFIVDYQVQERERIRQDEVEYLRQRQVNMDLEKETQRRQNEEEAFYRQQQLLLSAEDKRRKLIAEEEEKLSDQRTRLAAMNRELKMKELHLLEATRKKFLHFQQQQKEAELTRLDDEIRRKATQRETETKTAINEVEVRGIELELQKKMLEQEMQREFVETLGKEKSEMEARRHQQEMEERVNRNLLEAEREKELQIRKNLAQNMAQTEQLDTDAAFRKDVELRQRLTKLEEERKALEVARLQNESRRMEENVHSLMREVETRRAARAQDNYTDLEVLKRGTTEAELRRLNLIDEQVQEARHHVDTLHSTQDTIQDELRGIRTQSRLHDTLSSYDATGSSHNRPYLNDTTSTEVSTQFSLDRGRSDFEERERQLMSEVRAMREKLARNNRNKKPPQPYSALLT